MQGAAWKLTALAASLAVGFFGLMQVQQNLDKQSQNPTEFTEDNSQLENSQLGEDAPASGMLSAEDFAESQNEPEPDNSPYFKRDERNSPQNSSFEQYSAHPQTADAGNLPPQQEPTQNSDPFATAAVPGQAEPNSFDPPPTNENRTPRVPVNDPFADFRAPADQKFNEIKSEFANAGQKFERATQEQVDEWQSEIVQTANEVQADLNNVTEKPAQLMAPVVHAVQEFTGNNQQVPETEVAQELIQLAANTNAKPTDAPPPFFAFDNNEAKPIENAKTPQSTETPTPEMEQKDAPKAAFFPEPANESKPKLESFNVPVAGPKSGSPFDEPKTTKADKPTELPKVQPGSQFPGFNPSEPQDEPAPVAVPVANEEPLPAVNPQPELMAQPEAVPEFKPDPKPESNATPQPFFPSFEEDTKPDNLKADDPYRLVPEFNGNKPVAKPEMTESEPAPFMLTPPDTNSEPKADTAPADSSSPKPVPEAQEDPFAAQPPAERQPAEEKPAEEMRPSGFPTFSAGPENAEPPVKPEPAKLEPFQPEPAEEPAPALTTTPAPAMDPVPEKQTPPSNPFANQGFPKAEPEESTGNVRMNAEPAPLELNDQPATVLDDVLIGGARVDQDLSVSMLQPKIELHKNAPDNAVLGQPLIYTIEIENAGEVAVRDVIVEDKFPAGTKLTGTIPRAELIEKTLHWKFDELKPGERKKILVRVVPIESGKIGSVSTVSYKSTVSSQTMVTAPRLEIELKCTEEVALNEPVQVQFLVTNSGEGDAQNVILRNLIPDGLEHPAGTDLEYEIGQLKGGEQKEINLTMVARKVGALENVASVKADGDVSAQGKVKVNVIESVMSVAHSGPTRRFVGHVAEYKTAVQNNSSRVLENVRLVAQVPPGFEFQSATEKGMYNDQLRSITWVIPQLEPKQELEVSSKLAPSKVGAQNLIVTAEDSSGHQAEISTMVKIEGFPSLAVRIPDALGPVSQGERVSLRFKVVNRGSADATQVAITCKIPAQLQYISANGPVTGVQNGASITFKPMAKLMPNEEATFDLVFSAAQAGDGRVEFDVLADQITTPLKHQEQVIVYGE
ncbi:MAG TPA: hypothetical protein DIW81_23845 [Planctomycetaceae bacterium]|nr:hypothetical protein [Planctomycetaceae bacterium]